MNNFLVPLLAAMTVGFAAPLAQADFSVRLGGVGSPHRDKHHHHDSHWNCRHSFHDHRHGHRFQRPVYVSEVVIAPAYTPNDYASDLAKVNEKLARLRAILNRQHDNNTLASDSYERLMKRLEGIEHDQRERAFNRGGNLSSEDIADLHRRLDQVDEDLEKLLAA